MAKNPLGDVDYPWEDSKPLRKALKPGKKTGALSVMSPGQFLRHANPLKDTKEDRLLIDSFKDDMKKGKKFKYDLHVVFNKTAPNIPLDSPFEAIKYS